MITRVRARAHVQRAEGVVWRPGLCPFCGGPIKVLEPTVRCPECDTFHHAWCWRYNGKRCARHGCSGQTSFWILPLPTLPRIA